MKNRMWLLLVVLFVIPGSVLFSQNFNDALRLSFPGIGSSAKALGMGNSYTALSYDFSGTMFNPAGLGFANRFEFSGSLEYDSFNNDVTFFDNLTSYSNSATNLNQFGFVFPMPTTRGSLVFALGFNQTKSFNSAVQFDGFNNTNTSLIQEMASQNDDITYELFLTDATGIQTPINGQLNQSGDITESGRINKWSLSGAIEVAQSVFVGATLNIISGDYRSDRRYYEDDTRNIYDSSVRTDPEEPLTADFQTFFINDILEWDLSGWDAKIGFLYVLPEGLNLGASIKFPSQFTVNEKFFVDASSEFADAVFYLDPPIDNEYEYDIKTPFEFTGAAAYSVSGVTLSGEVNYIDYTQMEFGGDLDEALISRNNKDIKELFMGVVNYNLGVEYILPYPSLALRAGFIMQPSAYKDGPSEYDRKFITAGIGISPNKKFSLDFAYAYGWWKNFGDNYGADVSRTYHDITRNNFIVSFNYMFN